MDSPSLDPITLDGALVALAGSRRWHVLVEGLSVEDLRLVAAMCLFAREVRSGHAPGPFTSEHAERWARAMLA